MLNNDKNYAPSANPDAKKKLGKISYKFFQHASNEQAGWGAPAK